MSRMLVAGITLWVLAGFLFGYPLLGQDTLKTSVVVLRDTAATFEGEEAFRDEAVMLNGQGDVLNSINNLGLVQSISTQNQVVIDAENDRLFISEPLRNRISTFDQVGALISEIEIEQPGSIVLNSE
ncbi:MAG: hypothetical protein ACR2NP_19815, partial [Pirellulaceae bacterium]